MKAGVLGCLSWWWPKGEFIFHCGWEGGRTFSAGTGRWAAPSWPREFVACLSPAAGGCFLLNVCAAHPVHVIAAHCSALALPRNGLRGAFPSAALAGLGALTALDLSANFLSGSLPPAYFESARSLRCVIAVRWCSPHLGRRGCSALWGQRKDSPRRRCVCLLLLCCSVLRLDNNLLTGEVPESLYRLFLS